MKTPDCLNGCGRRAMVRGLCRQHYEPARASVAAGETTWDELVAAGRCLPPKPKWDRFKLRVQR